MASARKQKKIVVGVKGAVLTVGAFVFLFWSCGSLGVSAAGDASDTARREFAPHEKSAAPVEKISETEFAIGKLRLNTKQRSVRFPAVVNMTEGMIEYLCTTRYGNTHETLLATDVLPVEVHLAMLLISKSGEIPKSGTADTPFLPPGAPIDVRVEWKVATNTISQPLEGLVLDHKTRMPLNPGIFVYTSSRMRDHVFLGQLGGSIISLQEDPDALANIREKARRMGDVWTPKPNAVPAIGTPVEVEIRLSSFQRDETKDAPAQKTVPPIPSGQQDHPELRASNTTKQ